MPGGASLHNCMSGHGPDAETFERASKADLKPHYIDGTLAFMFETRLPVRPTRFALEEKILQHEYYECWQSLEEELHRQRQLICQRIELNERGTRRRLEPQELDRIGE